MGRNPVFKGSATTHGTARVGNVGRVLVCVALAVMLIVSAMVGLQRSAFAVGFPNDGREFRGIRSIIRLVHRIV